MEGGRMFMAAWRKEEVDTARHRQALPSGLEGGQLFVGWKFRRRF